MNEILLIAFHFPPQAGSSGIQRTLSFSKYLPSYQWKPYVLSATANAYEKTDATQLHQISTQVEVKRAWAFDTKKLFSLLGRYPEIFGLPDRWISWWLFALPLGVYTIRKNKIEVIWSTYPIATAHLIGLSLKIISGKKWIADFRDPMAQDDYPTSKWQHAAFRWVEKQTIKHCDAAVFTTYSAHDTYIKRYQSISADKFHVIENGYDEDGFEIKQENSAGNQPATNSKINLLHSGLLYREGRDPEPLFAAIQTLKISGVLDAENFSLILRATGEDAYYQALANNYSIDDLVFVKPPVPYQTALKEMLMADGLLVLQGTTFNTQIPAKLYEYFRAGKPIFGLVDLRGETANVLSKAGFDNLSDILSRDDITKTLVGFILQIKNGSAHSASKELIIASSRNARTQQLVRILSKISEENCCTI